MPPASLSLKQHHNAALCQLVAVKRSQAPGRFTCRMTDSRIFSPRGAHGVKRDGCCGCGGVVWALLLLCRLKGQGVDSAQMLRRCQVIVVTLKAEGGVWGKKKGVIVGVETLNQN